MSKRESVRTKTKGPAPLGRRVLHSGRWLELVELNYFDAAGIARTWEAASRCGGVNAVCIIARTVPGDRYLLVRQYRPPAGACVIEFPAGLVDPGESAADTAVRELFEETGRRGRVTAVTAPALNSPGLTDEAAALVFMEIDELHPENKAPAPHPDPGEYIEVFAVPAAEMAAFLEKAETRGDKVDGKVLAFFAGWMTGSLLCSG
ncbi:MAG: NUDIX hydrolase [Kiritimatiellaeota bacterium]|nr:NUDIX hydrolase [Kiritimatiellota bacterium]